MNKESLKRQLRIIRRKKWPVALVAFLIVAIIVAPFVMTAEANHKRFSYKKPLPLSSQMIVKSDRAKVHMIAHRGYSSQAPENTIPALQKAREYNFDTVEFDVRQTQDGVWVISHDADVKSMTDKKGKISSYTYYDLVTCNIDKGANYKEYELLKIPTLDHMLKACLEYNLKPMIEIKDFTESGIKTLLEIIERNGFTNTCSIISFDRSALEAVSKQNSEIQLYALVQKLNKEEMEKCLKNPKIGVSFNGHLKANNEDQIKKLLDAEIPLVCWTVDDKETLEKYFQMGVRDFVSNRIYPG